MSFDRRKKDLNVKKFQLYRLPSRVQKQNRSCCWNLFRHNEVSAHSDYFPGKAGVANIKASCQRFVKDLHLSMPIMGKICKSSSQLTSQIFSILA